MSVDEPSVLSKSVAETRSVEGPALSVDEPGEPSKFVGNAKTVEGLCFYRLAGFRFAAGKVASPVVHDVKQSKSVADARAVEGPGLSVDEPSVLSKSVADARADEGLCFYRLACFRFAAGKAASPVVHGVKPPSKSVADARAVESPALSVDEPSNLLKSVVDA